MLSGTKVEQGPFFVGAQHDVIQQGSALANQIHADAGSWKTTL